MNCDRHTIPDAQDWAGYEADIEARYGHKLMFGKSLEELAYLFRDTPSERATELLAVPRRVFQYYAFTFVRLFDSPAESVEQADCASVFLRLLCGREKQDPGSVAQIYSELRATVDYVAANQSFFDADIDIYGDFRDLAAELELLCEAPRAGC
jgi:hypothetical protein